ncbi:MAG: YdcF family protein [Bacillota bacterium]|nr:YdcF family protein [Bacillota bacterium]
MRSKLNLFLGITVIAIGTAGVLDFIFAMGYAVGLNLGIIFPLVFGLILIIYGLFRVKYREGHIIKNKIIRIVFMTAAYSFLISFILIESFIYSGTKADGYRKADYIVVLGAGLKGKDVTATLQYRLDKAIVILNQDADVKAVVTGGKGYGEEITEASAMENYLIKNGINKNRIIIEDKATSTYENFKFTKEILEKDTGKKSFSILVITSDFHMARAKLIAKKFGFITYGITAPTFKYLLPNSIIREYFAVIKSLIYGEII